MGISSNGLYPTFPNLELDLCMELESLATLGLTRDEILSGYGLEWEQLMNEEQRYFTQQFNKGKLRGLATVAKHLIKHSGNPNGIAATMAYLRRFATNYEASTDADPSAPGKENFSFFFGTAPELPAPAKIHTEPKADPKAATDKPHQFKPSVIKK